MSALNGRSPIAVTTDIGADFVRLALGVAQHMPDLLHAYWGQPEWLEVIMAAPPSLESLHDQAVAVATAVQKSNLPKNRQERLLRQTRALLWLIRAQLGEQIMFSEQVRLLLDVQPESVDSSVFAAAQEGLTAVLPDGDSLSQRWADWQATYTSTAQAILPQLQQALHALDQPCEIILTQAEVIAYRPGKVYLPTDWPIRVDRLGHLVVQWGVICGVVTAVYQRYQAGETECALWLNYSPQQVLAQGLPFAILSGSNLYDELIPTLLQEVNLRVIPAEQLQAIHMAEDALHWVDASVAVLLHGEGLRPRALRRYVMANKLVDGETAETLLAQLANPIYAAHLFAPLIGSPLIKAWLAQCQQSIANLLADPPVPSTMLFAVRFGD
ncbi:MAG: hypothetical protein KJ069_29345 [Anaerolineae bacterium]|nr:hypothetical protein [Anaerolineae bacterium]